MADPRVDDIVAMLDQFIIDGGGHMNIQVEEDGCIKQEVRTNSTECAFGDLACKIPNLEDGVIETENEAQF